MICASSYKLVSDTRFSGLIQETYDCLTAHIHLSVFLFDEFTYRTLKKSGSLQWTSQGLIRRKGPGSSSQSDAGERTL